MIKRFEKGKKYTFDKGTFTSLYPNSINSPITYEWVNDCNGEVVTVVDSLTGEILLENSFCGIPYSISPEWCVEVKEEKQDIMLRLFKKLAEECGKRSCGDCPLLTDDEMCVTRSKKNVFGVYNMLVEKGCYNER